MKLTHPEAEWTTERTTHLCVAARQDHIEMDLTLLLADAPSLRDYTRGFIERFQRDVDERLARCAAANPEA